MTKLPQTGGSYTRDAKGGLKPTVTPKPAPKPAKGPKPAAAKKEA